MTDIEKKAREYAKSDDGIGKYDYLGNEYEAYVDGVVDGAKFAICNQWRDASEELPEDMQEVIIAYIAENCERDDEILTKQATFRNGQYVYILDRMPNLAIPKKRVLAWLPIPDYKPKGE